MQEKHKPFFDHRYLMKPWGGNSILYTCQFAILSNDLQAYEAHIAIKSFIESAILELPTGESFSHDDMTAVVCLNQKFGLSHNQPELHKIDWTSRLHPRDIIFYLYSLGGIFRLISYPLLPILSICMIESVLNKTYKTINGNQVLATDGALLTFCRLNTFSFPITKFLVDLSLKFHKMKWSDYFLIYFGNEHPNYLLSKELNE